MERTQKKSLSGNGKNKDDIRPQFAGSMISARSTGKRLPEINKEIVLDVQTFKEGVLPFWIIKNEKIKSEMSLD